MQKETSYFSHDTNAKDDVKCVELIEQLGLEGYGIFWVLIETLRDQPSFSYPIKLLGALARRYLSSAEKFQTVVGNYGLFEITDDGKFFSISLNKRMEKIGEKHRKRVEAGRRGGNATAMLQQKSSNATAKKRKEKKEKERKLKETKEEKSARAQQQKFQIPTVSQITEYCQERNNQIDAQRFFDYYEAKGWMIGRNKMKSWKAAVRTWEGRQTTDKPRTQYGRQDGLKIDDFRDQMEILAGRD